MLRTAMLICLAGIYQATAVPYAAVVPTEEQHASEPAKLLLSLGEETEEADGEEGIDLDATPDEDIDADDLDLVTREMRNKNFLRFGRSPTSSRGGGVKDGNTIRFNRGEPDDNFIRLGRSANFVRFGRGGSDNTVKSPTIRSSNSHFIRLGRGKNAFLRLGRGGNGEELEDTAEGNESLARDTRAGSSSNFIRLGKAGYPSSSGFMRLGRKDNFLRFGKADNFLRFGRGGPNSNFIRLGKADNFLRFGRGGSSSNFIRLGKADNFLRFGRGGTGSNFIRLGKADQFVRLGRNAPNFNDFRFPDDKVDGSRFGRGKLADRNFIRLGRSDPDAARSEETVPDNAKTATGNSWATFIRHAPRTVRLGKRDLEVTDNNSNNNNRSKRSIDSSAEEESDSEEEELPFRFYRPLSSRMPNYVFAPELAVLPPFYSKRGSGTGSSNFIRLG